MRVPIRTPLYDERGVLTRPWIAFLEELTRGAEQKALPPTGPANPTTVSAAENAAERYKDENALVYTPITVTVTLPPNSGAEWIIVWITNYAQDGWDLVGKWWVGEAIKFYRVVHPASGAQWKVRVVSGKAIGGDNSPETAVESAFFTIAPIADATSTGITNASLGPLTYVQGSDGSYTWGLEYVQWTLPDAAADPNAWSSVLTVQKVDALGNPANDYEGEERNVLEDARMGQTVSHPIAWWTIPAANATYRRFRFRLYLFSRNETRVLQACWAGGATYGEAEPESKGLPLNPTSVSASENAAGRYPDENALINTPITVSVTMPPNHEADWITVWITNYAQDGWDLVGKWWVSDPITFYRLVHPSGGANWKVKAVSGKAVGGENPPNSAVESAFFAIAPIANAVANGITNASLGTVGYGTGYQGTGTTKWWGIDSVQFTLPTPAQDPSFWHSSLTVQKVDVSGNPAPDREGVEREVIQHTGFGASVDFPILYWTIPEPTSIYKYFRFRLYSVSRNGVKVLQTSCWSGAAFAQVEVPQPPDKGYLDLSTADPNTLGQGLTVKDGKLQEVVRSADNMILNPSFEDPLGLEWRPWNPNVTQYHYRNVGGGNGDTCCLIINGPEGGVRQGPISAQQFQEFWIRGFFARAADTPANAYLYFSVVAYDYYGVQKGSPVGLTLLPASEGTTYAEKSFTFMAPAGTSYLEVQIVADGGYSPALTGGWRVDGLEMRRQVNAAVIADNAIIASKIAAHAITAANQALDANAVVDSNIASVNVSKLIAGTVIFTGTAVFSRGSSQPVIVLENTGIHLFGVADGSGGAGLTSSPYVAIESGGIGLYHGSTGRSVVLTPASVLLYTVNASTSDPYVSLSATGITLSDGGTGPSIALTGTQITLQNGNYSVAISASQVQLAQSGGASVTLTSSSVELRTSATAYITLDASGHAKFYASGAYTDIYGSTVQATYLDGYYLSTNTVNFEGVTSTSASAGSYALPSNPAGFLDVQVGGVWKKIPYYNN